MALKVHKRTTTIVTEEIDTDVGPAPDPTPDDPVVDPVIVPDAVYPAGDYRKGIVMPQGGDDYTTGNFGTGDFAQPTSKSSNWNSNGDSLFPYFYKNAKGVNVELDLEIAEAIGGHYLARVKINTWPEAIDSANPIRARIQLANSVGVANTDRFWNLVSTKTISKFGPAGEYWLDITANMVTRGLLTVGQFNVNGQVLYLYLCSKNYSSGKLCIITDGGGTWLRKGTAWIDEV